MKYQGKGVANPKIHNKIAKIPPRPIANTPTPTPKIRGPSAAATIAGKRTKIDITKKRVYCCVDFLI